jgi:biopolymer transport protein ExbB/TolQ
MKDLFLHAGWVAWPLGFCSILALGVILERLFTLFWLAQQEDRAFIALQMAFEQASKRGETPDEAILRNPQVAAAPVTQVLLTVQPLRGAHIDAIQTAAEIAIGMQRLRLRRYLSTLATIGSTAPFIGLFGTVLGVMSAFQAMSRSGLSGETMAAGISEALSATALGLLVAIPSVIAYNFLVGRVQALLLPIQAHVARLTPLLQAAARTTREA